MKSLLAIGLLALFLTSCKKDPSGIPDVAVNFHASLDNPALQPLNVIGGSVEITGHGVAGLIIYRSALSQGAYFAYDRCSTVDAEKRCAVKIDNSGFTATDPCSKAVFSLEDGNPQTSPGQFPLKRYSVTVSPGRILSVTN